MTDIVTQLGVGGLTAYVVLKETFAFLRIRNGNSNGKIVERLTRLEIQSARTETTLTEGIIPRLERLESDMAER